MTAQNLLSAKTLNLLNDFVANFGKKDKVSEVANIAQAIAYDISKDKKYAKELKEEVLEQVKGEIATKDFVRAELATAKESIKDEIHKSFWRIAWTIVLSVAGATIILCGGLWTLYKHISSF